MLHILLLILKIIGFILLGILGLILLILTAVLFVPIRYRVSGYSKDTYELRAQVSWLLHILHVSGWFDNDKIIRMRIRIFGIPIIKKDLDLFHKEEPVDDDTFEAELEALFNEEEEEDATIVIMEEKSETQDVISVIPEDKASDETAAVTEKAISVPEKAAEIKPEPVAAKVIKPVKPTVTSDRKVKASKDKKSDKKEEKDSSPSKWDTIRGKIQDVKGKADEFLTFLQSPQFSRAFAKAKKEVFLILKRILPRKAVGHITYGFDDPQTTGKLLGFFSIINAHIPATLILTPDFNKTVLFGDGYLKGHIRVIGLLIPALRLLISKDIRYCIKQFRKK